jgi:hypothetical protein
MVAPMSDVDALLLQLTSFSPARVKASPECWGELMQLAPPHGVAPLIAYNLEYRLAGSNAPQPVRDVLMGQYQGALADNVFKLVNLKTALTQCPGKPVLLLEAAAVADALYPHIAFRPTHELRLLVHAEDLQTFVRGFGAAGYGLIDEDDALGGHNVLSDGRTQIVLHTRLFAEARHADERAMWNRATKAMAYGRDALRPAMEDALLCAVLFQARAGFDCALLQTLDLRELVRGSPALGGPYSRPLDTKVVLERARIFRLDRALWAAMELVATLFPDLGEKARALQPPVRSASARLLRRWVVEPASRLHRTRAPRGLERLRTLLAGG